MLIVISQNERFTAVLGSGSKITIPVKSAYGGWEIRVGLMNTLMGTFSTLAKAKGVMNEMHDNLIYAAALLSSDQSHLLDTDKGKVYLREFLTYQIPKDKAVK